MVAMVNHPQQYLIDPVAMGSAPLIIIKFEKINILSSYLKMDRTFKILKKYLVHRSLGSI